MKEYMFSEEEARVMCEALKDLWHNRAKHAKDASSFKDTTWALKEDFKQITFKP